MNEKISDGTVPLKIIQKPDVLSWMNVKEDLALIPYSLLCATAMIVEVIEHNLVILVGTQLYFFSRFIIRNFSFKCSIFRFIHFCC